MVVARPCAMNVASQEPFWQQGLLPLSGFTSYGAVSMTDDSKSQSPRPAPIGPKPPLSSQTPDKPPPDRRESDHVEAPGHVERELPPKVGDERKKDEKGEWPNEGEGNRTADREYRKGTEEFAKSGRVQEQAQKAADALDGAEGDELRQAEEAGRQGRPRSSEKQRGGHTDRDE